jgi:hypothetical protein
VPRSNKIIHLSKKRSGLAAGKPFDLSFSDTLPGVDRVYADFNAPGQLVWRKPDGSQKIIFDCVNGMPAQGIVPPQNNGDEACVPMDPSVSFDGTKVAFAVYRGKVKKYRSFNRFNRSSGLVWHMYKRLGASIYIYNFKTGKLTHWRYKKDVWDTAPVWLPNGKMMFTSTRSNVYARVSKNGGGTKPILQLWEANRNGTDAHNVGDQAQDFVLHPLVTKQGRVMFSIREAVAPRYKSMVAHVTATFNNLWWVDSVDLRGGNLIGHLGTHYYHALPIKNGTVTLRALHFIGQLSNGDVCVDSYYRRNNDGGGTIVCWPTENTDLSPEGHEGKYPFKGPKGLYFGAKGAGGDEPDGPKLRDPAGLPNGKMLLSAALGTCRGKTSASKVSELSQKTLNGAKYDTCDFGIYVIIPLQNTYAKVRRSAKVIVNSPDWHEFMPKPVMPYKAIYGIAKPKQPPLTNTDSDDRDYGVFASVDAYKGNVLAANSWNDGSTHKSWQGPSSLTWCRVQGCALQAPAFVTHKKGNDWDDIKPDKMKYIRFWRVIPQKPPHIPTSHGAGHAIADLWGQQVKLMGDVPIEPDGSFKAKLPANVPFLMAGVDAQGRAIARHQHVMAMRPGEKQVCAGCHLHSTTDAQNAGHPFSGTIAANLPAVSPTIRFKDEKKQPEWRADIYPMLTKNCNSPNGGGVKSHRINFDLDPRKLYSQITNYNKHYLVYARGHSKKKTPDGSHARSPWVTRWINGLFSRESPLYWKAVGKRVDGRADDTLKGKDYDYRDLNFSCHLNETQQRILSDWIEEGMYCDTSKHTCGIKQ